jgi:hypothetical protein
LYKSTSIILLALLLALACVTANAAALYSPGLNTIDIALSFPSGGFVGGFDVLPNGNYLINDGRNIREISRTGQPDTTLYTFTSSVYGSFVRYNPSNGKVYFGESSNGVISAFTYTNPSDVAAITTIANNFDIDFRNGLPYAVGCDSSWSHSSIYLIGGSTNDLIATCLGPSGPLAFDSAGNLVYIPASYDVTTSIIKWSSAQIAGAIGPSSLTGASATPLATIESGYGSAFNSTGGLLFTNLATNEIQLYNGGTPTTLATFVAPGGTWPFISMVRENPVTGAISAVVSYTDTQGSHTVISQMAIPEPSSLLALCSLIGLAGSAKLLRRPRK